MRVETRVIGRLRVEGRKIKRREKRELEEKRMLQGGEESREESRKAKRREERGSVARRMVKRRKHKRKDERKEKR